MKFFRAFFFFLPSLDFVVAHRFDICWNGADANCGSEGRVVATEGAVLLLRGARKERACAIDAETDCRLVARCHPKLWNGGRGCQDIR